MTAIDAIVARLLEVPVEQRWDILEYLRSEEPQAYVLVLNALDKPE